MKKEKKTELMPEYVPPRIVTFTREQILEQIGPAQACSPDPDKDAFGNFLDENGMPIPPDKLY